MKNIALYAVIGLAVGLLLAEFLPNLGKGSFESSVSDMAFALGKKKPYETYAAIGAVVGAIVGALTGKK